MAHALIVDDSASTLESLEQLVKLEGFTTATAATMDQARVELAKQPPDVVLVDLNLPDGSGLSLFDSINGLSDTPPAVVLITGQASLDSAVEALRRGVSDYLTKPLDVERLRRFCRTSRRRSDSPTSCASCVRSSSERDVSSGLSGGRSAIVRACELISRIAPSSASVLITGESGSGKDVVARAIHELSRRRHGPCVPVNCGAISPTLMESELFGHERGSFTGADRRHKGYFERAHARHAVPRRNHRDADRAAGQAAARARDRHVHARRRREADPGRRAHPRRDQPRPAAGDRRRASCARTCTTG